MIFKIKFSYTLKLQLFYRFAMTAKFIAWRFIDTNPSTDEPPHEGVGLLHVQVKFTIPPPQVLLHGPCFHELHPP